MEPKAPVLGRTVLFLFGVAGMLLAAALILVRFGDAGAKMFDTLALAYVGLGGWAAGKSTVEALGTGSGLKGVAATVLGATKPGEPPAA